MKKKTLKSVSLLNILVYLAFAVFYLWMAAQIPYTHDDWDWGLENGIVQLLTANINSRYVGNFFVVIMTRSELLKSLIMGLGYFLVPLLIASVMARNENGNIRLYRVGYFLMANVLLLTMDRSVWQQTYGWVSGFANYVISSVFLLINFSVLLRVFDDEIERDDTSIAQEAVFFFSCLIGQLFLENLALFMVLASITACVVYYIRTHRVSRKMVLMSAGTILGLLIMFSSKIYSTFWNTGAAVDGARLLVLRSDAGVLRNIANCMVQLARLLKRGAEEHLVLSVFNMVMLICALIRKELLSHKWKCLLIGVNILLIVYFGVVNVLNVEYTKTSTVVAMLGAAVNMMYFVVVTLEIICLFKDRQWEMYKKLAIWLSTLVFLGPLVITTEAGPRLFYVSNIFVILFVCTIVQDMIACMHVKKVRYLITCLVSFSCVLLVWHSNIFAAIGTCRLERNACISDGVESKSEEIVLPKYPYEEYLWLPDPTNDKRMEFFKEFYNIPQECNVIFE